MTKDTKTEGASDPKTYGDCMAEIKWRIDALDKIILQSKQSFLSSEIEYAALQLRMIFELIAISSIAANKEAFEEFGKRYLTTWNLAEIIKAVKKLNPCYYPIPVKQEISYSHGNNRRIIKHNAIKDGFLTENELISFHGYLGKILHAKNPYKQRTNYSYEIEKFREWRNKIIKLLNCHELQLYNEHQRLVVSMHTEDDGKVSWAIIERAGKIEDMDRY